MKSNAKYLRSVVAIVGIALGLILTMPMVLADTVEVVPLNSAKSETGKDYGEWSAAWWQYVFSIPVHNPSKPGQILNPLFDEKGNRCGVDQPSSSPVFFLVGVVNVSGTVTRTKCTVPAGKRLFFPVLNVEADNEFQDHELTEGELRALANSFIRTTTDLHASIDGVLVSDLSHFRVKSPIFTYTMPVTDNILGITCSGTTLPTCTDSSGETVSFPGLTCSSVTCTADEAVSDGFYLMIEPLSPGSHTINFGGTFGPPINFTLDVTYNPLTVAP